MDMFSQLTDDLLIKVVSFLPTKDAVVMSVLAKRWVSLWKMVPRLTFEDVWEDIEETNQVHCDPVRSHFVSGVLIFNKSPFLECFHLTTDWELGASEIGLWVRIAVDRFVRDLKISFDGENRLIKLPHKLFTCQTLETLELKGVIFLEVPLCFSFQSLKMLRLLSVKYADEDSFIRLISSSAVLGNLVVDSCTDDNVATFTIVVPSLRSLTVRNTLQDSGPNYDNLFVIHPHSLNKLNIVDEMGEVNLICEVPKLVEATLYMTETRGNALESLTFAKRLSLSLDREAQFPTGSIFFQLVHLEFCGREVNWSSSLMHVLQYSPILQFLKLSVMDDQPNIWTPEEVEIIRWIQPSSVPECMLFHLKTFEWIEYGGTEKQKEVAIYILKNARRLVTATISLDPFKFLSKDQVFEELESVTRGSRACELVVEQNIYV